MEKSVIIKSLTVGPIMANCYILGCEKTAAAVVIDPGDDVDKILLALSESKLTVKYIVNTHGHFDHVGGNRKLKEATGADILIHADDAPMLGHLKEAAASFGLKSDTSPAPDRLLKDGDSLSFGNITLQVLHTPGHSPGGIALYTPGAVFVGDTLFAGSIGRTDLPGGNFDVLKKSIHNQLFTLPEDVTVYPGHMGTTTIGREKHTNPFVGIGA
jgi:glyoxylase-like metal-dependent hydrolase (beta-lactamase superfamily II)